MSEKVVVSRTYGDAEIKHLVRVDEGDIAIEMSLSSFLSVLASEIDGIPTMMTQAQLRSKLLAQAQVVIADMKYSTIHNTPEFKP